MKRLGTLRALLMIGSVATTLLLGLTGCRKPAEDTPVPAQLVILTPHNETIRDTFQEGFWNWHVRARGVPVEITWIYRGTPQCVDYVADGTKPRGEGDRYTPADLMFGGGLTDHARLAALGLSQPIDVGDALAALPAEVQGTPTRDPNKHWFTTGLSSFGILYNAEACRQRDIAPPQTWADLAAPRFAGWLAIADPAASGSHRECCVLILEQLGWDAGWQTLMGILANTRALNSRSGDALRQVRAGTALATFAVNFDGLAEVAESDGALAYVDPAGLTSATPDFISGLTTGRNSQVARDFIRYVLSEEGQTLWGVERDHRAPYGQTLYHYPIVPAIYTKYAGHMAGLRDPSVEPLGKPLDAQRAAHLGRLVSPLVWAICGEGRHVLLQQAWARATALDPADANAAALRTALAAPPFDLSAGLAQGAQLENASDADVAALRAKWAAEFAARYAPTGS